MMSMQHPDLEHKQADSGLRRDKDDFKKQSAELRMSRGVAGVETLNKPEFMRPHPGNANVDSNVPLEPTVQAPRKIHHTSPADFAFSSIPDSKPVEGESTTPSSGPMGMEKVGMEAGRGIEAAKAKLEPLLEPVVAKAQSLYEMWKEGDSSSTSESGTADVKERASAAASQVKDTYNEKIAPAISDAAAQAKPMLEKASAKAQEVAANARPAVESAIDQAKPVLANAASQAQTIYQEQVLPMANSAVATASKVYKEQVAPALSSGMNAASEQIGAIREDGLSKTMEKAGTAYQRRVASAKESINSTYEAKVPLEQRERIAHISEELGTKVRAGWQRGLQLWQTKAMPVLRVQGQKAMVVIRERKLQAPLAILGLVVLLWLSWSLLSAVWPNRAANEQVVVYQPDWRPSTGPIQGAETPGLMDKARASISGVDSKIMDGVDSVKERTIDSLERIKARSADLAQHAQDSIHLGVDSIKMRAEELKNSMPSTDDIKARMPDMPSTDEIKARASSTIESAKASMPSTADIKARMPSTEDIKARMPSTEDIKARMPSTEDIKARIPSTDDLKGAASELKARIPDVKQGDSIIGKIKNQAAGLKDRIASATSTDIPSGESSSRLSDIRLKVNDRFEHVKALLPEQLSSLRTRLGNLYDRLTPAQRHFAHAHPEVLDPENHVIEFVDEHGNKKSMLD